MPPTSQREKFHCTKCSAADIKAGRGGSIWTDVLVRAFRDGKPTPTCRVCEAKYGRPPKAAFDKWGASVNQLVEGARPKPQPDTRAEQRTKQLEKKVTDLTK